VRRIALRYIAWEMVPPFISWLMGLLVMIAGSLLFSILKAAGPREVPMRDVLVFLAGKLPWGLVMSIPMAFAFAACLTINRLSRDGELTALRVGGLSPRALSAPVIVLGGFLSLFALATNEYLVPWATDRSYEAARSLFFMASNITPQSNVFLQGPDGFVLFARTVNPEGNAMYGIEVIERDTEGRRVVSTCPSGTIRGSSVTLTTLTRQVFDDKGRLAEITTVPQREVDTGEIFRELFSSRKPLEEMSARDLARRAGALRRTGRDARETLHNLHFKLAVPFAAMAFAAVSMPLILRITGSGFTGAMMAIGIVFLYYCGTAWGKILAGGGQVSPVVGAWACNAVFGVVGAVALWRSG
jgi:lipopolysaccharide export system permease protein